MTLINWQYCKDPNEINRVLEKGSCDWEGLKHAEQIINITYDTNHRCYVVFWRVAR